jgi:tetratricopeptide (TPR) repeat protein
LLAPVEAPDFSLPDFGGEVRTLSSLRGKPVLLNLWAAGAERCKEDWIAFNQRHAAWAAQGLQLLTVNLDASADAESVRAMVRKHRLSFPILRGSDDVAGIYNILYRLLFDRHRDLALPTSFLINARGEIAKVYQGPVNPEHVEQDFRHIPQNSAERLARALPFPGVTDAIEFGRNYLSYGSVFFQRGYMDQAEASFRIALRDDPASAEALYGIGSVYLSQQKTTEARQSFERALKLRASYPDTLANSWNNLGLLAAREGRTGEAIGYFQKALALSPDHLIALDNLGSAYRQQKSWGDARKTYERALDVSPNDAEANYGLGMVFAQNDDTARAYDSLQRALKLRPAYPEALNNLGILYLRTERRDEAVASFEECIRVAPTFDQSYLNLARVYAIEDAPEKARAVLLELLKQHPGHQQAQKMIEQIGR